MFLLIYVLYNALPLLYREIFFTISNIHVSFPQAVPELRQRPARLHPRPKTRHPGRPPRGVRAQPEEAAALRTGLWPRRPKRRTQGPQLRARTPIPDPAAATETERLPAGPDRAEVHDQRAEEGAAAAQGFHEGDEGVEPGHEGDRRRDGTGRGA